MICNQIVHQKRDENLQTHTGFARSGRNYTLSDLWHLLLALATRVTYSVMLGGNVGGWKGGKVESMKGGKVER